MLFWPEISALGVFFNFDNERMHPPKYQSAPPPPGEKLKEATGISDTLFWHTVSPVAVTTFQELFHTIQERVIKLSDCISRPPQWVQQMHICHIGHSITRIFHHHHPYLALKVIISFTFSLLYISFKVIFLIVVIL